MKEKMRATERGRKKKKRRKLLDVFDPLASKLWWPLVSLDRLNTL